MERLVHFLILCLVVQLVCYIIFIRFFLIVIQTNRFDGVFVGLWSTYRSRTGPFTPRHYLVDKKFAKD